MRLDVEITGLALIAVRNDRKEAGAYILEDACHKARLVFQEASLLEFQPQGNWTRPLRPVEAPGQPLAFEIDITGLIIKPPEDESGQITAPNSFGSGGYPMKPVVSNWGDLSHALNLWKMATPKSIAEIATQSAALMPIGSGTLSALKPVDPRMENQCWDVPLMSGKVQQGISDRLGVTIVRRTDQTMTIGFEDRSGDSVAYMRLSPFPGTDVACLVLTSQCEWEAGKTGMPDVVLYQRCFSDSTKISAPVFCPQPPAKPMTGPVALTPNATRCPPALVEY